MYLSDGQDQRNETPVSITMPMHMWAVVVATVKADIPNFAQTSEWSRDLYWILSSIDRSVVDR